MEKDTLLLLEKVNQLSLTEDERACVLAFFGEMEKDKAALDKIDTEKVERMVHALPIETVVREDVAKKILEAYAADLRGVFALHARAVLGRSRELKDGAR